MGVNVRVPKPTHFSLHSLIAGYNWLYYIYSYPQTIIQKEENRRKKMKIKSKKEGQPTARIRKSNSHTKRIWLCISGQTIIQKALHSFLPAATVRKHLGTMGECGSFLGLGSTTGLK